MQQEQLDYKDLLRRYMAHVWEEEGTDFLDSCRPVYLTEEQMAQLRKLAEEGMPSEVEKVQRGTPPDSHISHVVPPEIFTPLLNKVVA